MRSTRVAEELKKEVGSLKKQLKNARRDVDNEHKKVKALQESSAETKEKLESADTRMQDMQKHHDEEMRWRLSAAEVEITVGRI